MYVYTQACTPNTHIHMCIHIAQACTAHTHICVYTGMYSTAHIYIRVYTGLYTSHPYTCIHITQACTVSVHCTAHIHICTCIHRHVHLTPIYVYTQACTLYSTAHTYIRVYTSMYSSHLYSCIYRHVLYIVQLTTIVYWYTGISCHSCTVQYIPGFRWLSDILPRYCTLYTVQHTSL